MALSIVSISPAAPPVWTLPNAAVSYAAVRICGPSVSKCWSDSARQPSMVAVSASEPPI
ncbi:MAG: hypothetical protein ACXU8N_15070 [Telluria sp.]